MSKRPHDADALRIATLESKLALERAKSAALAQKNEHLATRHDALVRFHCAEHNVRGFQNMYSPHPNLDFAPLSTALQRDPFTETVPFDELTSEECHRMGLPTDMGEYDDEGCVVLPAGFRNRPYNILDPASLDGAPPPQDDEPRRASLRRGVHRMLRVFKHRWDQEVQRIRKEHRESAVIGELLIDPVPPEFRGGSFFAKRQIGMFGFVDGDIPDGAVVKDQRDFDSRGYIFRLDITEPMVAIDDLVRHFFDVWAPEQKPGYMNARHEFFALMRLLDNPLVHHANAKIVRWWRDIYWRNKGYAATKRHFEACAKRLRV